MTRLHRYGWELALAALLMIEILGFGALNPRLLDLNVLLFSTSDFICIGIVALPLTMVIVSGGIDISFGSTMGLCAIALGVMFRGGVPLPLAIILTLALGALCGLINAGLIIYTGVNPLIITRERYTCSAAAHCCCRGWRERPVMKVSAASRRASPILPISMCWICPSPDLLSRQRDLFLVADAPDPRRTQCLPDWAEPRVALYSAIPVNRTLYALYAMTGFASAVAAVLLVSYFGSARSDLGASFLMPAITAVVRAAPISTAAPGQFSVLPSPRCWWAICSRDCRWLACPIRYPAPSPAHC